MRKDWEGNGLTREMRDEKQLGGEGQTTDERQLGGERANKGKEG